MAFLAVYAISQRSTARQKTRLRCRAEEGKSALRVARAATRRVNTQKPMSNA